MLQSGEKIAITADFINRVDRHMSAMPEGFGREFIPPSGANGTTVLVYNAYFVPLAAYIAVELGAGERINQGTVIFAATPASMNATQKIAILQMPLAPGQAGPAIVSGGSLVALSGTGDGDFATLGGAGKFQLVVKGDYRVLWKSADRLSAFVTDAPPDLSYKGYFAVERVTIDGVTWIRVFDSAKPDSPIAGKTDLGDVPVTLLPNVVSSGSVYLVGEWTGTAYSVFVTTTKPYYWRNGFYELASIDTKIVQRYLGGAQINFAERYFV